MAELLDWDFYILYLLLSERPEMKEPGHLAISSQWPVNCLTQISGHALHPGLTAQFQFAWENWDCSDVMSKYWWVHWDWLLSCGWTTEVEPDRGIWDMMKGCESIGKTIEPPGNLLHSCELLIGRQISEYSCVVSDYWNDGPWGNEDGSNPAPQSRDRGSQSRYSSLSLFLQTRPLRSSFTTNQRSWLYRPKLG